MTNVTPLQTSSCSHTEFVRKKQQGRSWDWETLVRKLSQVNCHESSNTTLSLPLGLKNCRRIWRCLEEARVEARVDDVANAPRYRLLGWSFEPCWVNRTGRYIKSLMSLSRYLQGLIRPQHRVVQISR
ncbi:hypothetical protein F5Y08DRAFT_41351 [Xylaria arbuscula]|nr:hypothetical protein F5Y08DRAFT_41351 [Xylaria arbuscula]